MPPQTMPISCRSALGEASPSGCLYDGSADVKTFDEKECAQIEETVPAATRQGRRFATARGS
jgi:hypothetical protein